MTQGSIDATPLQKAIQRGFTKPNEAAHDFQG